ncbi:MAG TPA: SPOR domain-containing protein [Methyloceanibacter sp.]|nr:SPOR domain-containing protein [Methyloceanibacter sp.]
MAENRKSFRARRLAFGGRLLPRACIFGASLVLCAVLGAAHAQEAGLKSGAASLAAGKYDNAVRQLSATINSDSASPGDAAKALYLRGIAYRKMGEPARAVADLGAAIWLGLPEPDRVKALVNRGLAFKAAGLGKEGEAELAVARKVGGSRAVDDLVAEGGGAPEGAAAIAAFATEVRPEADGGSSAPSPPPGSEARPTRTANAAQDAAPGSWDTSIAGEEQQSSSSGGNRLTRWFGSLSDSPPSVPPPPQASAAPAPPPSKPTPQQPSAAAASSSWSTTTDTQEAASASAGEGESKSRWSRLFNRTAEADPGAQPAAAPSAAGAYRLQLATSRSEEEAKALWKKVSQNQAVAGVQPQIEKVDIGSFGTFYSLRIGPFPDKAESLKVCNALKRSGIDCSLAEQ